MRYKIPQNIDMQDRIIGPLTMIQFVYAVVGGGLCYSIYMSIPAPFSYALVTPAAILTLAIVFLKINERPFLSFLLSVVQFYTVPRERIWHHIDNTNLEIEVYKPKVVAKPVVQAKVLTREEIADLARKMDQR